MPTEQQKQAAITNMTRDLDSSTEEYTRTVLQLNAMSDPGKKYTVTYSPNAPNIWGTNTGIPVDECDCVAGKCPSCTVCGHKWMWECHDNDCQCCIAVCT